MPMMQMPYGPRAAVLMQQALRPAPIETPTALLGRLAVLAAGQQQQRQFEQQVADARAQFTAGVSSGDMNARLAAIQAGMSSPDPQIASAAASLFKQMQPEDKIVGTPGGGSAVVPTVGGRVTGAPQEIVPGRAAAPQILEFKDGETVRSLMFDPNGGGLVDLATAPRETLQRILPPDVYRQQIALRQASGAAQGEAVGRVMAETTARAQATADVKRGEQQAAQERYRGAAREALAKIEAAIAAAGPTGAIDPNQRAKLDGLRTAAAIAIARAQSENPEQEPNSDIVQGFKAMIPGAVGGAAGITGGLEAAFGLVGGRPAKPAGGGAKPAPAGVPPELWEIMTPEERAAWD